MDSLLRRWTLTGAAALCLAACTSAMGNPVLSLDPDDDEEQMPEAPIEKVVLPGDKMGEKPKDPAAETQAPKTIYTIPVIGEFGKDFSFTPLREIMRDAKKQQPDYLLVFVDARFQFMGRSMQDEAAVMGAQIAFNGLEKAAELATILTDEVRDDKTWVKKPKLIFWVRKALGPSAFLPLVGPDIYFTSDGKQGGMGGLDRLMNGRGDHVVREKQRSLRLGRAVGLAEKGGYRKEIVWAMARGDYPLSINMVGGKPEYHEDLSGEIILSDAGDEENGRGDTLDQLVRAEGNDCLTLNADMALKIGISKATVNSMEELAFELGIARNYKRLDGRAEKIINEWGRAVRKAEFELGNLWRDYNRTPIEGNTPDERNRGRSKRIGILNKMKDIVKRYGESINAGQVRAPTQDSDLNSLIEQLQQQIRLDKPRPGTGGGAGRR